MSSDSSAAVQTSDNKTEGVAVQTSVNKTDRSHSDVLSSKTLSHQVGLIRRLMGETISRKLNDVSVVHGCSVRILVVNEPQETPHSLFFHLGKAIFNEEYAYSATVLIAVKEKMMSWTFHRRVDGGYPKAEGLVSPYLLKFGEAWIKKENVATSVVLGTPQLEDLAEGRPMDFTPRDVLPPPDLVQLGSPTNTAHLIVDRTPWLSQESIGRSSGVERRGRNEAFEPSQFEDIVMEPSDYALGKQLDRQAIDYYRAAVLTPEEEEKDKEEEKKTAEVPVDDLDNEEGEEEDDTQSNSLREAATPPSSIKTAISLPSAHTPSSPDGDPLTSSRSVLSPTCRTPHSSVKSTDSSPLPSSGERSGAGGEDRPMAVPHSTPPSAHSSPRVASYSSSTDHFQSPPRPSLKRVLPQADLELQPRPKLAKWLVVLRSENKSLREVAAEMEMKFHLERLENQDLQTQLDHANGELAQYTPSTAPLPHQKEALDLKTRVEALLRMDRLPLKVDKKKGDDTVQSFWRSISATFNVRVRMLKATAHAVLPRLSHGTINNGANRAAIEAFIDSSFAALDGLDELQKMAEGFHAHVQAQSGRVRSSHHIRGLYRQFKEAGQIHLEEFHQWDAAVKAIAY